MATIYALVLDCIERRVLGGDVDITVSAQDESNTRISVRKIAADIKTSAGSGLVALLGAQTNQFPWAVGLALDLKALSVRVCIGGFHPSGCLSMLKRATP